MAGTDQLSAVFSALSDPTRRAILAVLAERAAPVTELTAPLSISMPAGSQPHYMLERTSLIPRTRSGTERSRGGGQQGGQGTGWAASGGRSDEKGNSADRHLACVRRAAGARLPSLHRSRPLGGVVGADRQLTAAG